MRLPSQAVDLYTVSQTGLRGLLIKVVYDNEKRNKSKHRDLTEKGKGDFEAEVGASR